MLEDALTSGDANKLARVSRRYFHTSAGYDATFLLGLNYLDHAAPLAAALTLRKLAEVSDASDRFEPALTLAMAAAWLHVGDEHQARNALLACKERRPAPVMNVGGQNVHWFEKDSDALRWLTQLIGPSPSVEPAQAGPTSMQRDNLDRNASISASPPSSSLCWRIPLLEGADDRDLFEANFHRLQQQRWAKGMPLLPGFSPLVIGDTVLMRTSQLLEAVDINTGKRLWETPIHDWPKSRPLIDQMGFKRMPPVLTGLLTDSAYGTLSSDGRYVFGLEDTAPSYQYRVQGADRREGLRYGVFADNPVLGGGVHGRLAAYDLLANGKLAWRVEGGPDTDWQALTFLGPPLPLQGQLFVLAEIANEIRLLALDANTGHCLWSQALAIVDREMPESRLCAISPSYCDGILVCPTGGGAVVAVDLATQSLLWGHRYCRDKRILTSSSFGMRWGRTPIAQAPLVPLWFSTTAAIVDGRVVITPVESGELYCLNLADGTLAWDPLPRRDGLHVADIHRGKIVVAGLDGVRMPSVWPMVLQLGMGELSRFPPTPRPRAVDMPAAIAIISRLETRKFWRSI